ncbi:MAG: MFS transporter [Candidatus Hodarchaeales archaeon]
MTATPAEDSKYKHHESKKSTIVTSEIREKKRSPVITFTIAFVMSIYTIGASFAGYFALMELGPYLAPVLNMSREVIEPLKNTYVGLGSLAFLISVIIGGSISDDVRSRFGNRLPMVFCGAMIYGGGHIIAPSIIPIMPMVFSPVLLIIINIGAGLAYSPLLALLSELFTKEERVWAGMVIGLVAVIGTALSTAVYPAIVDPNQKWLITGLVIIIAAIVTVLLTPKTNPDFPPDETISDILKTPIYLLKLGGGRNFLVMFIVQALWGAAMYTITLNLPAFFPEYAGLTVEQVNIFNFVLGIGGMLFAVPVGLVINKLGKTKGALVGTFILALYVMLLTVFTQFEILVLIAIIGGTGMVFIQAVTVALPADIVPEGKEGQFMGIFTFAAGFPTPFMAVISGVIIEQAGYGNLFFTVVIILVVAGFLLLGLNYENMLESEYNAWYKRYLEFRGLVKTTIDKSLDKLDTSASILRNKMLKDSF